jgi:hypothetical protein
MFVRMSERQRLRWERSMGAYNHYRKFADQHPARCKHSLRRQKREEHMCEVG